MHLELALDGAGCKYSSLTIPLRNNSLVHSDLKADTHPALSRNASVRKAFAAWATFAGPLLLRIAFRLMPLSFKSHSSCLSWKIWPDPRTSWVFRSGLGDRSMDEQQVATVKASVSESYRQTVTDRCACGHAWLWGLRRATDSTVPLHHVHPAPRLHSSNVVVHALAFVVTVYNNWGTLEGCLLQDHTSGARLPRSVHPLCSDLAGTT